MAALLESDGELVVGQERKALADHALEIVVQRTAGIDGAVFRQPFEHQVAFRGLLVQSVPETAEAALAPDVVGGEVGLVVHLGKILAVQVVGGEAEIAVAKRHVVGADGVVAEIEVRRDVLPGVENLDAVVTQVPFSVIGVEEVVGLLAQLDLVILDQDAVEQALFDDEARLEIHEGDFDQFSHSVVRTDCWSDNPWRPSASLFSASAAGWSRDTGRRGLSRGRRPAGPGGWPGGFSSGPGLFSGSRKPG